MTVEHIRRLRTNDVLPKRLAKLADSLAINSGCSGVVIASSGGRRLAQVKFVTAPQSRGLRSFNYSCC
jgi:hypothetical protein